MRDSMNGDYVRVRLTSDELRAACQHGVARRISKLNGRRFLDRLAWDREIEGAGAEMALSKFYDRFWTGLRAVRSPDSRYSEARWTEHYDIGGLIVYPKDDDDRRFVLLDGFAPEYRIIGWLWGREAKQPRFWCERSPAPPDLYQHHEGPSGYYLVPRQKIQAFPETADEF